MLVQYEIWVLTVYTSIVIVWTACKIDVLVTFRATSHTALIVCFYSKRVVDISIETSI